VHKPISLTLTIAGAVALCSAVLRATPAHADVITKFLTNGDSVISGFPGPYASVTINLINSTTANITFQALGNYTIEAVDLHVNVTGYPNATIPTASNSYSNFTPNLCCAAIGPTGDPVDDFGRFNVILTNFGDALTFVNSATTIDTTLNDITGTWSSAEEVLSNNDHGVDAATFVYVCNANPCTLAGGATNTGYASVEPVPAPVIDGGFPALLAVGGILFIAELLGCRKRQAPILNHPQRWPGKRTA
jgi:hypothetical protein